MTIELPPIIQKYVNASNAHNVKSILACFSGDSFVRDEQEEHRGKKSIEAWVVKTIEKYNFHFKPLSVKDSDEEVIVTIQVSGTFDGSPVTLDYHFGIAKEKISSLAIE